MSVMSNLKEDNGRTRDNSPSAQSHHSAALEWDPSADIGTQVPTNTPVHVTRGTRTENNFADLSTLERIVISLSKGYELRSSKSTSKEVGSSSADEKLIGDVGDQQGVPSDGSNSNDSSYKTATEEQSPELSVSNSSSSWQTSGLTKSEIEYRSKKEKSESEHSSSSILWVEIKPEKQSKVSRSTSDHLKTDNPTTTKTVEVQHTELLENKAVDSKIPHKNKKTSTYSRQRTSRKSGTCHHACPCPSRFQCQCQTQCHSHKCHSRRCQLLYVPMDCFYQTGLTEGKGSGNLLKSVPPEHATQSQELDTPPSITDSSLQSEPGEITPTCEMLGKLLNENDSAVRKYGYEFLEMHRNSLVSKMRKEFHHLERLNKLLLTQKLSELRNSRSSGSNGDSHLSSSDDRNGVSDNVQTNMQVSHTVSWSSNANSEGSKTSDQPPDSKVYKKSTNAAFSKFKKNIPVDPHYSEICAFQKPISYFVPLKATHVYSAQRTRTRQQQGPSTHNKENQRYYPSDDSANSNTNNCIVFENEMIQISLQQAFQQHCPDILANLQYREQMLQNLKQERQSVAEVKRNYFSSHNCLSPNESLNQALPKREPRLMSMRQMRHITEKKLKKLPEVQEKLHKRRKEEEKKTNRLLTQVFSRLQSLTVPVPSPPDSSPLHGSQENCGSMYYKEKRMCLIRGP